MGRSLLQYVIWLMDLSKPLFPKSQHNLATRTASQCPSWSCFRKRENTRDPDSHFLSFTHIPQSLFWAVCAYTAQWFRQSYTFPAERLLAYLPFIALWNAGWGKCTELIEYSEKKREKQTNFRSQLCVWVYPLFEALHFAPRHKKRLWRIHTAGRGH